MTPQEPAKRHEIQLEPQDVVPGRNYVNPYDAAQETRSIWQYILSALKARLRWPRGLH
ncbi:MAG: hypothetical protein AAF641_16060 [Pseudomonadota bacterium]